MTHPASWRHFQASVSQTLGRLRGSSETFSLLEEDAMNYQEKHLCLAITQIDKGWEWVCNTNSVILAKSLI